MNAIIIERITDYVAALNNAAIKFEGCYSIETGRKYHKVVQTIGDDQRSVHCFIEIATGDVYKAAGWSKPARHVRCRLMDDQQFANVINTVSQGGMGGAGHLYLR